MWKICGIKCCPYGHLSWITPTIAFTAAIIYATASLRCSVAITQDDLYIGYWQRQLVDQEQSCEYFSFRNDAIWKMNQVLSIIGTFTSLVFSILDFWLCYVHFPLSLLCFMLLGHIMNTVWCGLIVYGSQQSSIYQDENCRQGPGMELSFIGMILWGISVVLLFGIMCLESRRGRDDRLVVDEKDKDNENDDMEQARQQHDDNENDHNDDDYSSSDDDDRMTIPTTIGVDESKRPNKPPQRNRRPKLPKEVDPSIGPPTEIQAESLSNHDTTSHKKKAKKKTTNNSSEHIHTRNRNNEESSSSKQPSSRSSSKPRKKKDDDDNDNNDNAAIVVYNDEPKPPRRKKSNVSTASKRTKSSSHSPKRTSSSSSKRTSSHSPKRKSSSQQPRTSSHSPKRTSSSHSPKRTSSHSPKRKSSGVHSTTMHGISNHSTDTIDA